MTTLRLPEFDIDNRPLAKGDHVLIIPKDCDTGFEAPVVETDQGLCVNISTPAWEARLKASNGLFSSRRIRR